MEKQIDMVNHPPHYEEQSVRLEPIFFCERLPFCHGNALKYVFRAGHKAGSTELEDLKKARFYLERRNDFDLGSMARFGSLVDVLTQSKNEMLSSSAEKALGEDDIFFNLLEERVGDRIKELE